MSEPAPTRWRNAEVIRRAVVTGAVIGLVAVGMRIPLPFVDPAAYRLIAAQGGTSQLSLFALGLTPFVNAFILVELVALVVPALRRRRHGPYGERAPLVRGAWVLGATFAAVQGYGIVTYLRSMVGPYGFPLLGDGRPRAVVALTLTLAAGSVVVAWAASIIGRRGLGNGFAVLLVAMPLCELPGRIGAVWRSASSAVSPALIAWAMVLLLVLAVLFGWTLRFRLGTVPSVPVPSCGIVPSHVAASLLLLPAALVGWLPAMRGWADALRPGTTAYQAATAILVFALALLAARLFCPPQGVGAAWSAALPGAGAPARSAVGLALSTASVFSVLLLLVIAIVIPGLTERVSLPLGGATLLRVLVLTAVLLDLGAEVRAVGRGAGLVPVYPLHRVYAVEPVRAALSAAGIEAHVRGRYFRALWHFFAPFVPVEVMVPPDRAAEAEAICERIARAEPAATAAGEPAAS